MLHIKRDKIRRAAFLFARLILLLAMSSCVIRRPAPTLVESSASAPMTPAPGPTDIAPHLNPAVRTPEFSATLVSSSLGSAEKPIVVSADYASGFFSDVFSRWQGWARRLGDSAGLNFSVQPGPSTEMEVLEGLGAGKIHVAYVSPLAYLFGNERNWVTPGAASVWYGQTATAIMIVARSDSGLKPGESPQAFLQLAGKRPCWPESEHKVYPELSTSILPGGLLALHSIKTGPPVFVRGSLDAAAFRGECDFAVVNAATPASYQTLLPQELFEAGISFERWTNEMQILYTSPPISPAEVLVFSPRLPVEVQMQIIQAALKAEAFYPNLKFHTFDEEAETYIEFSRIVAASGVDIQSYLTTPQWIPDTSAIEPTWVAPPSNTIVVDAYLSGGLPFFPYTVNQQLNSLVLPAIYAELVRLDAGGQYVPYLALSVPTLENGLVRFVGSGADEHMEVEFHLRPNLRWQDGRPLTAEDLIFSWKLVMDPDWPGSHHGMIHLAPEVFVISVDAPAPDRVVYRFMSQRQAREAAESGGQLGDRTIYSDLAAPIGPVVPPDYLDVGRNVFPKHLLENVPVSEIASSNFARHPIYAGAYRFVEGGNGDEPVVLEAFDEFALGKPGISRVVFGSNYYSSGANTYWQPPDLLAEAFRAGAIQAQLALPAVRSREGENPQTYDELALQGLAKAVWVARDSWEVLDFNLDNSHLADLRVRQAIAHAINRQAIIDQVLAGHGALMRSYLPNWHPLYAGDAALPDYTYDPNRARELLEEAGYDVSRTPAVHPTRGPLTLRLDSMDVNVYPRPPIARLIQQSLAAIGIQVEVRFHSWPEFEAQDCSGIRNGRDFDLGMAAWVGALDRYPTEWLEQATTKASIPTPENGCPYEKSNWPGWYNARADEILVQLKDGRLALEQPNVYKRLWAEHQKLWVSELPSLPLFNSERPVTTSPQLIGVQASPLAFGGGVEDTWNIFEWVIK